MRGWRGVRGLVEEFWAHGYFGGKKRRVKGLSDGFPILQRNPFLISPNIEGLDEGTEHNK